MIAIVTTLPNWSFEIYGKQMIKSVVEHFPKDTSFLIQLDDDLLQDQVQKLIRPTTDAVAVGWTQDHLDFVNRNKDKDDKNDYRKQVTRFCHKVFALHRAYEAVKRQREQNAALAPRYLIWMDADTIVTKPVSMDDLKECLPKDGDAVSYLGRKDWPHSECGWLAFDLENEGGAIIDVMYGIYVSDQVFNLSEWHDSWVFDHVKNSADAPKCTNLTEDKPGMDIWPYSPMGKWSTHHKGPKAKQNLAPKQVQQPLPTGTNFIINTKNSVPDEKIHEHIRENQSLIKNWVRRCIPTDEQIIVVSAGPQLYAEDVLPDYEAGKKIVAVKHALDPLKKAGIRPWACILLDPRPHVYNFVSDPDTEVIWFIASQVDPKVTARLLAKGCTVWGYHASVGANEQDITALQQEAVIGGGSATATRGLYLLAHLGFTKFKLFGYDLCFPDKPDLNEVDDQKQPKYMEMSVGWNNPLSPAKKCFWTKPELVAQFEELNQIIQNKTFDLEAVGDGIIPFILKAKKAGELRQERLKVSMGFGKPVSYKRLLKWKTNTKKIRLSTQSVRKYLKTLFRI